MLTATLFFEDCSKFNITYLEIILNGPKNSLVLEMPIFPVVSLRCQQIIGYEKQCSTLISMGRLCLSAAIQCFRKLHPLNFYDFQHVLDISEDKVIYG